MGVAAWIVAIVSLALTVASVAFALNERRERMRERTKLLEGSVSRFHIDSEASRQEFYRATIAVVDEARHQMFKAGRGVNLRPDPNDQTVQKYVRAEEEALQRGVQLWRIQLASKVSGPWPSLIAELTEKYPGRYRIYEDFTDRSFLNVSVVDPDTDHSVVEFLFDTPRRSAVAARYTATDALIVRKNRGLAQAVRAIFEERIQLLQVMSPHRIREMAFEHYYFAYGANMDPATMRSRAPDSDAIGKAYLDDWELKFGVPGEHLEGGGAAIIPATGQRVWGVLYAITDDDKYRLDIAESEAYHPEFLTIVSSVDGSTRSAMVYLPKEGVLQSQGMSPDNDYLMRMLTAARTWSIDPLAKQLESIIAGSKSSQS